MDGIASAASSMGAAQTQASVDIKVLKQAQDMAKGQAAQMLNSIPKAANMPGMGGTIDVSA